MRVPLPSSAQIPSVPPSIWAWAFIVARPSPLSHSPWSPFCSFDGCFLRKPRELHYGEARPSSSWSPLDMRFRSVSWAVRSWVERWRSCFSERLRASSARFISLIPVTDPPQGLPKGTIRIGHDHPVQRHSSLRFTFSQIERPTTICRNTHLLIGRNT